MIKRTKWSNLDIKIWILYSLMHLQDCTSPLLSFLIFPQTHVPILAKTHKCYQLSPSLAILGYINPFLLWSTSVNSQTHPLPFDTQTHTCQNPSASTASCISTHSLVHIPILTIVHQCQQLTPSVPILWCTYPSLLHSTSVNNQTHPPPFSYPSLLESTSDNNQPTSISLSRHTHPSFLGSTFVKSQPLLSSFSQYSYPSLLGSISDYNQPTSISLSRHTHPSFLGSTFVKSQPFSPVSLSIRTHLC